MSNIYLEIQNLVDECCMLKCGKVPETESDCEAVNKYVECPRCHDQKKYVTSQGEEECCLKSAELVAEPAGFPENIFVV